MDNTKSKILRVVQRYPGIHFRATARETDLSASLTQHHLDGLHKRGQVLRERVGRFVRYFDADDHRGITASKLRVVNQLRRRASLEVLYVLLAEGPLRHKELAARLEISKGGLTYRIQGLERQGLVSRTDDGYAIPDEDELLELFDRYPVPSSTIGRMTEAARKASRAVEDRQHPPPDMSGQG